jgi:hypothetical protein
MDGGRGGAGQAGAKSELSYDGNRMAAKKYSRREFARRYRYAQWWLAKENANWRGLSTRRHRAKSNRMLKAAADYDALMLPTEPRTTGWLTW